MKGDGTVTENDELHNERWELLAHVDALTEKPMTALSFIWLLLLVVDLTVGLGTTLTLISYLIWALFVLDFLIEFWIAPDKSTYLRTRWLTALALLLPALRVFRLFRLFRLLRAARTARSLSFVRLVTSLNRGMGALRRSLGQKGVGYVTALTAVITFVGAAGMFFFERSVATEELGLDSYGEALWWTAMIMTTLGSEYWPQTAEGRVLGWLLSVYALAVFGYITATIASYFVVAGPTRGDAGNKDGTAAQGSGADDLEALRLEVAALRQQLAALTSRLPPP